MIAWFDLETTGLNPKTDVIVEVACVVTDDDLREVARFERVLHHEQGYALARLIPEHIPAASAATGIDPYVISMHIANGLWAASAATTSSSGAVAAELVEFLLEHGARPERPQLGGSSVHFDRSFLVEDMPRVVELLHHRHLDASVLNEFARRTWPDVYAKRPHGEPAHRAMADVLASIEIARYYRSALAPIAADPALVTQQIARWLYENPGCSINNIINGILRGDWRRPLPTATGPS